jgi:hypothetical protein
MTSAFALPMPDIIDDLIATKAIPALNAPQLSDVTRYLFKYASNRLRIAVGEIAYRDHKHAHAFDLFLASTMPLAQKWTEQKARNLFVYPTDWQLECFYNGAVSALLKSIQNPFPLRSTPDAFRRFLPYRFACGAIEAYFTRYENHRMHTVKNLDSVAPRSAPCHNPIEQELITRELLEKISEYPLLQRALSKTLQCIRELGPDLALKERHWAEERNPECSKKGFAGRPMLNVQVIAKARGITPGVVFCELSSARKILRKAFNGDGRLFQTH